MAISTRTHDSGANAYTLARLLVPTGDMPMAKRFALISEATGTARAGSATANLDTLATVAAALPLSLVTRLARQQSQTVDFATSNLRAAPFPVYVAGAKIAENYPIGPLGGVAFNLTLMSYDGSLDMGLHTDAAAVGQPDLLRRLMEGAFEEFLETGT
jgi:diacylglycerol O-acyltransferase